MYTNGNWFVILMSRVYFKDCVTEIHCFNLLNDILAHNSEYFESLWSVCFVQILKRCFNFSSSSGEGTTVTSFLTTTQFPGNTPRSSSTTKIELGPSLITKYSQGSNTERSKTESIQKPNVSKFGFRMVRFSNVWNHIHLWSIHSYGTDHSKTELQNGRSSLGRFI